MRQELIKRIIRPTLRYGIIFILMLLIFCTGMIITYALPNQRIQGHIKESLEFISAKQNTNPLFGNDVKGAQLDEFTDLIILNTAMNKGKEENESIFVRAFENSSYLNNEQQQLSSLANLVENENIYNNQGYERYWHGIQTIIRPLLLIFNYEEIRLLFMIVMFSLFMITGICISRNFSILHALAFVFSIMAVCFFIVPISMQYVSVFAITLLSVIIINILLEKKKEKFLPYMFFIVGGLTTFFDLLTVPLLTLGIPIIFLILFRYKNNNKIKIMDIIIEIIKLSILWCISYAAMYFIKWIIASVVLQRNAIKTAVDQMLFRMSKNGQYTATKFGAIKENIKFLNNKVISVLFIIITIIWIFAMKKYKKDIKDIKIVIPLMMLSLYPYAWYVVFKGHSTIHAWFTYRIQAISILSVLTVMIESVNFEKMKTKKVEVNKISKKCNSKKK